MVEFKINKGSLNKWSSNDNFLNISTYKENVIAIAT